MKKTLIYIGVAVAALAAYRYFKTKKSGGTLDKASATKMTDQKTEQVKQKLASIGVSKSNIAQAMRNV